MKGHRAAIIGCGEQSLHHAAAYYDAGIPIVAGADISREALQQFSDATGARNVYTNHQDLLQEVRPDIVSITAPSRLHCQMAIDAANAGTRGIFCEKPMAMNLREADRMLDACRASGSRLIINHQRYYEPAYVRARAMLAEDAIGSIRSAEAYCRASTLLGDGTHAIHMLLCLMRNRRVSHLIGQVDAHWSEGPDPMPQSENSGVAFLALEQDTWAYLTWGRASRDPERFLHPGDWHRYYQSFVIYGDEGRLEIGSDGPEDELRYLRIRRGPQVEHAQGLNQMDKITLHRSCITMAIRDLVCSIETGCSHPLDGEGGRDVMEIIMAIHGSAQGGRVMTLSTEDPR